MSFRIRDTHQFIINTVKPPLEEKRKKKGKKSKKKVHGIHTSVQKRYDSTGRRRKAGFGIKHRFVTDNSDHF